MDTKLVSVRKYSKRIRELSILKRVSSDYPLLVRDDVALMLSNVSNNLPGGLMLQIDSAYRSRQTQKALWSYRNKKKETKKLVYNPDRGISPHTTGGAVDLSLLNSTGKEINLSEPFPKFYNEPKLRSSKISQEASELRFLLYRLMTEEGFVSNPKEYWHFSYGDETWARFKGKTPLYKEIDLSIDWYYKFYVRFYYRVLRKLWRMLITCLKIPTNY